MIDSRQDPLRAVRRAAVHELSFTELADDEAVWDPSTLLEDQTPAEADQYYHARALVSAYAILAHLEYARAVMQLIEMAKTLKKVRAVADATWMERCELIGKPGGALAYFMERPHPALEAFAAAADMAYEAAAQYLGDRHDQDCGLRTHDGLLARFRRREQD